MTLYILCGSSLSSFKKRKAHKSIVVEFIGICVTQHLTNFKFFLLLFEVSVCVLCWKCVIYLFMTINLVCFRFNEYFECKQKFENGCKIFSCLLKFYYLGVKFWIGKNVQFWNSKQQFFFIFSKKSKVFKRIESSWLSLNSLQKY